MKTKNSEINQILRKIYQSKLLNSEDEIRRNKILRDIKVALCDYKDAKIVLIGSNAYGLGTKNGDLDVVCILSENYYNFSNEYLLQKDVDEIDVITNKPNKYFKNKVYDESSKENEGNSCSIRNDKTMESDSCKSSENITQENYSNDVFKEDVNIFESYRKQNLFYILDEMPNNKDSDLLSLSSVLKNTDKNTMCYLHDESKKTEYKNNKLNLTNDKILNDDNEKPNVKFENNLNDIDKANFFQEKLNEKICQETLNEIGGLLEDYGFYVQKLLYNASIPIIRFKCRNSDINIDMSINQHSAIENTALIKNIIHDNPYLKPIIVLIKSTCKSFNINSSYQCTLSSYSISLMVIFFFQVIGLISPIYQKKKKIKWPELELVDSIKGFFFFYGWIFNYKEHVISVVMGKYKNKSECKFKVNTLKYNFDLCIEDPIILDFNVTRTVNEESLEKIICAFRIVYYSLCCNDLTFFV